MGTVDSTQDFYRNIWAVKVRGSLHDAKQLFSSMVWCMTDMSSQPSQWLIDMHKMSHHFSRSLRRGCFYLNGGRENKTFKFFLLDNIFDGDSRFYTRCLYKYLGCESTWKSTRREAIVLQAWFRVRQTCEFFHFNFG